MEERTTENEGKWKAKERKQSWGLPGRGDMEQGPEIREVTLGMVTRTERLRKLRDGGRQRVQSQGWQNRHPTTACVSSGDKVPRSHLAKALGHLGLVERGLENGAGP